MKTLLARLRSRWLMRAVIAIFAIFILLIVWKIGEREWTRSVSNQELAAAIEETDRSDPDWRWEALNAKRPRPPEGRNGADLIRLIKNQMSEDWGKPLFIQGWEPVRDIPANTRFPAEVIVEARRVCEIRPAIELARSLKDRPLGLRVLQLTPMVTNTPLPDTQSTRSVSDLLHWDAVLAIEDGNRIQATDSVHAMLNASRSIGDETCLTSQLARMATRMRATRALEWVLAQTELTVERLSALQAAWATDAEDPLLLYALRGERATLDVLMENLQSGVTHPGTWPEVGEVHRGLLGELRWWHYRGWLPGDRARLLHNFNTVVEAARKPVEEQVQNKSTFNVPPHDRNHRIAGLLFPPTKAVAESYWRSVADMRCAIAALACERYRLKHGSWPASLAALVTDYLHAVLRDPFDGQPVRMKHVADGIIIYSLGVDQTDDGGDLRRPDNPNGKDEGFRLWNAKERRKPAAQRPAELKDEAP